MCKYNGWVRLILYQGMYNVIICFLEFELIFVLRCYGFDFVVYNFFVGGFFLGKIKIKDFVFVEGRFSDSIIMMGKMYCNRYFKDFIFQVFKIVEEVVEKVGIMFIEVVLRWVVYYLVLNIKVGNDGVIIGVSSYEQLNGNLMDLEKGLLLEEVVKVFDEVWKVNKVDMVNYWYGEVKYGYDMREVFFGVGVK